MRSGPRPRVASSAASAGIDLPVYVRRVWDRVSAPERAAEFRLFFAVYGQALQAPGAFADFLGHVIADPVSAFAFGSGDADVLRTATLVIATLRGLLLDLLTTGDHDRVRAAAEAFIANLEVLREPRIAGEQNLTD
jgi:hypothetical protein